MQLRGFWLRAENLQYRNDTDEYGEPKERKTCLAAQPRASGNCYQGNDDRGKEYNHGNRDPAGRGCIIGSGRLLHEVPRRGVWSAVRGHMLIIVIEKGVN